MPRALETIRRMRGGAQSHLMRCADGHYYVVKPVNNVQVQHNSGRVLANELLGTRLAAHMGLPVPPCEVIEVSQELIELTADLRIQQGHRSEPWRAGPHFGSRYPGEPARTVVHDLLPDEQLRDVENLQDFLGALVFDKLSCNVNGRQAIFLPAAGARYRALFIDQGFCFGAADWKFPDAAMRGLFHRHRVYQSVRGLESFEPWLARIEEKLTMNEIGAIAGEIPLEWYEDDAAALEQLIEQLDHRRTDVQRLIVDAKNSPRQPFVYWQ